MNVLPCGWCRTPCRVRWWRRFPARWGPWSCCPAGSARRTGLVFTLDRAGVELYGPMVRAAARASPRSSGPTGGPGSRWPAERHGPATWARACERGALSLAGTVGELLPRYRDTDKARLTVTELLTHTSGLPGRVPMYRGHPTRESLLTGLGTLPLRSAPGVRVEYSSQGFMLLGLIAEHAGGQGLDALVDELVCTPLGMEDTGFAPGPGDRERAVATERCPWRGRTVMGEVHDENAAVLGGIAGHAGLFATLADTERLAVCLA
ncbi:serine hydrolase domain-containing protein, partial [Streptomyces sp. NPDC102451]|uniref:serine hydrolase domain-containing protein n=1 Tax=Streptomyces sp. NPDC102451 TaxID=3366177 RepID=UPI0037F3FDC8